MGLKSIGTAVAQRLRQGPSGIADPLRFWQERVLHAILLACVVLGFFTYLPSLWLSLKERLWFVALVDTAVYAWILTVFFRRDFSYRLRSGSFVLISYVLGVVLLLVVGPFGAGPVWLFAFPVMAGILMGRRMSLVALACNGATLLATGMAIWTGAVQWPLAEENPIAKWVVSCINFMLLDSLATISISVLFNGLRASLAQEKSLRVMVEENENRLKTVFDSVHTGIFIIDADSRRIADVNPAAAAMIGAPLGAIVGRACRDYLDEAIFSNGPQRQDVALSSESTLTVAGGRQRPIMITINTVRLNNRPHLLASFLDISSLRMAEQDRAALEAQLAKARNMEALGTLAGGIAHDFNNILAGIIGFTELAQEKAGAGSQLQEDLGEVFTAAQRAKDLVQQILAFSRRDKRQPKPVRVKSLVTEALALFRASLPAGIEIRTAFSADPVAMIDPTQFHQVLMNLFINTRHALEERGGVIEVGLEVNGGPPAAALGKTPSDGGAWLHFWVRDDGCGMPPAVAARIFEPFFTTRPAGQGSGMGLAVVHGIVDSHGGVISVDTAPGVGTQVDLYLPQGIAGNIAAAEDQQRVTGGAERIMVVDDDGAVLKAVVRSLEALGYAVTAKVSGAGALAQLHQSANRIDLVVTDINMPEMTGIALLAAVKGLRPGLPVILFTGDAGQISAKAAADLGAAALAVKPLSRPELARLVRGVLDGRFQTRPTAAAAAGAASQSSETAAS